ncbi:hypothetical protein RB195_024892 [Necator americanus]|uniref:Uncharacterized protein n=1 Tax=Necator americanus TaxID=51031 RepID=A0ABR1EPZ4_NECAM
MTDSAQPPAAWFVHMEERVIQMKSLMGVLFVTALLVLFGLATPKPIDINEQCGPFVGSRKIKFTKSQKKWSKLEPSIRYFKRTALPVYVIKK